MRVLGTLSYLNKGKSAFAKPVRAAKMALIIAATMVYSSFSCSHTLIC